MQKFGIEIRKVGSTKNLYNDIDMILAKNGMGQKLVSDDMIAQTTAHALQKMLKSDSHFSVCTVKECAKLCSICIPQERQNIYSAAHCISWSEMLPDYRQLLVAMVLDDFRVVLCPEN